MLRTILTFVLILAAAELFADEKKAWTASGS